MNEYNKKIVEQVKKRIQAREQYGIRIIQPAPVYVTRDGREFDFEEDAITYSKSLSKE